MSRNQRKRDQERINPIIFDLHRIHISVNQLLIINERNQRGSLSKNTKKAQKVCKRNRLNT